MTSPARIPIPRLIQLSVLDQSRRRCALCFHFKGDLTEKLGQIAHLNDDRANSAEDNLAFLCLEHHSVYDSETSQHKNYTIDEAKSARTRLYEAIARGEHVAGLRPASAAGLETDRQTLARIIDLMAKTGSIQFLRPDNFVGSSFRSSNLEGIEQFLHQHEAEYEFIDPDLEGLRSAFKATCHSLISYVAYDTFVVGDGGLQGIPPEWKRDDMPRFISAVKELHAKADNVCAAYDDFIRTARRRLAP